MCLQRVDRQGRRYPMTGERVQDRSDPKPAGPKGDGVKRVPRRRGASQAAPKRPPRPAAGPTSVARPKSKERLDVALVTRGLAPTREKAARLIMAGHVEGDGRRADKAGGLLDETAPAALAPHP